MDEHFGVRLDGRVLDEETTGETGDEEEEEAGMSGLSAGEVRARYAKAAREKELAKQRGGRALPAQRSFPSRRPCSQTEETANLHATTTPWSSPSRSSTS